MLNIILWGGVIAALIYYYVIKPLYYWKNRGVTQAKLSTALWDNFSPFLRLENLPDFDTKIYNRFKHSSRYSGGYLLSMPFLIIHDPELIKQIAVKDFDHFPDHQNLMPENVDPLWERNLFVLQGQRWREMRPILSPSFTTSKMKSIFVIMSDSVHNFIEHFAAKNETILELDMKDVFTRLGNDIIASTAFGVKVDSLAQPDNEFYRMGKRILEFGGIMTSIKFITFIFFPRVAQAIKIRMFGEDVSRFFHNLIDETIKTREENNIVRPDMLNLLMDAQKGKVKQEENEVIDTGYATAQEHNTEKVSNTGKCIEITNTDITAQAMIFFFGGFDSVTNLMSFLAYELALNTDIQDRLRKEIKGTDTDCKGKLTYEALMQMKYMDMVVSECLRKWPNGVALDRISTKPYTIEPKNQNEQPIHLDVGTRIHISVYGMHHDSDYWPNPDKFDPERFNEENKPKIKPYTYYPFGLGPRSCIASRFALMEVKTLFYHLLLNFEIVPTKKTPIPPVVSKYSCNLTLQNNGFRMALKRIGS